MSPANGADTGDGFGDRVRVRGRDWTIETRIHAENCSSIRLRANGRDGALTLLTPFERPVALVHATRPRVVTPRRWLHDLDRALLSLRPFGSLPAAAQAPIRLLPYQLEPALAISRDGISRVLIADGVGLG